MAARRVPEPVDAAIAEGWPIDGTDGFIDHDLGSWRHRLDPHNRLSGVTWNGKPDTYHAFQATLIPRLP